MLNVTTGTKVNVPFFKFILTRTQDELRANMTNFLNDLDFERVISTKAYVYAKGTIPVLLIAHLDTVHRWEPTSKTILHDEGLGLMWSLDGIGGDDRCGVYSIAHICYALRKTGKMPHVLFTTDEEIGGVGAMAFADTEELDVNFIIELDRSGINDMVFYNTKNVRFARFIGTYGFELSFGTFTDVSVISPRYNIAGVNLSVGYFNEHTDAEYVDITYMEQTIVKVLQILNDVAFDNMYKNVKFTATYKVPKRNQYTIYVEHLATKWGYMEGIEISSMEYCKLKALYEHTYLEAFRYGVDMYSLGDDLYIEDDARGVIFIRKGYYKRNIYRKTSGFHDYQ